MLKMRSFILSVLVGLLVGCAFGASLGAIRASLHPWKVDVEVNRGEFFVKLAEQEAAAEKEATPEKTVAASDPDKGPRAKIDETTFDFGILEKNPSSEKGEHSFYIENVGNEEMTLADGGKGCFCTTFTISKSRLKPGEKATVLFKWDAARSGGVFNQGIRVLTNDPNAKEVLFIVKGLYTAPIISDPPELFFPNASASAEVSRAFRVLGFEKNEDESPYDLQIEEIELSDPEHFEVSLDRDDLANLTDDDRENRLLSQTTNLFAGMLTMKPGMPQGSFQEILRLRTNSPKTPIFEIPIRGQISGSTIKVVGRLYDEKTSGQLRLDKVVQSTGADASLRLNIFDTMIVNEKTAYVKSVRPDWLKVELTYQPEEVQKATKLRMVDVNIQIAPGSPEGAFMGPEKEKLGEIVFAVGSSEDSMQEVVVPVRFAVVKE